MNTKYLTTKFINTVSRTAHILFIEEQHGDGSEFLAYMHNLVITLVTQLPTRVI